MSIDLTSPEAIRDLLLQSKYQAAIRRVARGVTHSYNNIFTGLGGQMAILRQEPAFPVDPACKRGEMIDNLLMRGMEQTAVLYDFTRDADTGSRSHSPLLIATKALELLNSISRMHRFLLKSQGVGQEKILCNLRELILILFYLGENCVDATPEGGDIDLTINRREDKSVGMVDFRFHDHGPGFPEEILSARFAPFVTTSSDAHRGLGLYAADTLARKNGGRLVTVRSNRGQAAVSAVFPAVEEERAVSRADGKRRNKERPNESPARQCFLVVEDDEAMRTLLLYRLQRRGHMVFCVETCAEALEEYEYLHDVITIILMDVGLQDTSGYGCLREMLKVNEQARIIFMSGHHEEPPPELTGGHTFLHKPFTLDQLDQAILHV